MSVLLTTKSKMLEENIRIYLKELQQRYLRGEIKSMAELQYELGQAITDMYLKLGRPSFIAREADVYPVSDDFNAMMTELGNDLNVLYAECAGLGQAVDAEFKGTEIIRQSIQAKVATLTTRVKAVADKASEAVDVEVFKESFVDGSMLDVDIIEGTQALVNTRAGCLTLNVTEEDVVQDATIQVDAANCLPGNTHQVRVTGDKYRFYGEDGLHLNPGDILDGNADTWFECESFYIDPKVKEKMSGLGFEYHEGVAWANATGLTIDLHLELPVAQIVNWVSLVPFISPDKGAVGAVIKEIILDSGKGAKSVICKNLFMQKEAVFLVPRQKVKRIIVKLEQQRPYTTTVGHWGFRESRQENARYVPGPLPSVENLGVKYNPQSRGVIWPVYTGQAIDEVAAKNNLFNVTSKDLEVVLEAVPALRYQVGLREITLANYRFDTTSTYISKAFTAKGVISDLTLDADIYIPAEFPAGDWVKFYFSIDDGQSWNRIYPQQAVGTSLIKRYAINQNLPMEGREPGVGYLDTEENVRSVRLKVVTDRPGIESLAEADYYTPLVLEYNLRATVRG